MYHVGDTVETDLNGIPGLGNWTIRGTATILDVQPGHTTYLLMAITNTVGTDAFYAVGRLSTGLDGHGPRTVHRPTTTGLQPTHIALGAITGNTQAHIDPDAAYSALSPFHGSLAPGGPLTEASLPMLDRALQDIANRRDQTTAAEQERDDLIRRLLAGGVNPKTLLARTGLSRSRIHQIGKPKQAA